MVAVARCAQVGETVASRRPACLPSRRALAVDHLVVGKGEHVVLGCRRRWSRKVIGVVVPAPVDRDPGPQVEEAVVHPAHVPLEVEAEAAVVGRRRHPGEGGRFLGHRHCARALAAHHLVGSAQEGDRLQVLAPAMDIRQPLAFLARIVAVQHRRHRVDAQAVHPLALDPVQRAADQEVAHLVAAEVVDQGVPVVVVALARIGVFIERGAVETSASPKASLGKCAGTQSSSTPRPWARQASR